jgi:multidrug efflux pump subunit AcrB
VFGERRYSMRLWLDPNKLANRNLTAGDVVRALQEQNVRRWRPASALRRQCRVRPIRSA